ncbi:MAG: tetrahydrofolate dehydrogenase/cyclohydrolase catalytic domain-containing protein [Candidatus Levyibacteriota bacterium]
MELSGKVLAEPVLEGIRTDVLRLTEKGSIPELAILTVGGEDAWFSYVSQKQKTAERLGIRPNLIHLSENSQEELIKKLGTLNRDPKIHGIIVQRPIPKTFDRKKVIDGISPVKDIDGFRDDSIYIVPVLLAIQHFIRAAYGVITASDLQKVLINQSVCVVGKGETAGGPTIEWLSSIHAQFSVVDSKTKNPCEHLKKADLIICASGKSGIIKPECLKKGVVLIGVGTHKENGKLTGDYNVDAIKNIAKVWTPTPGGVGPLNLAYLFQNLLTAAKKQTENK